MVNDALSRDWLCSVWGLRCYVQDYKKWVHLGKTIFPLDYFLFHRTIYKRDCDTFFIIFCGYKSKSNYNRLSPLQMAIHGRICFCKCILKKYVLIHSLNNFGTCTCTFLITRHLVIKKYYQVKQENVFSHNQSSGYMKINNFTIL